MTKFQLDNNINFADLSVMQNVLLSMQKSMEQDDLSKPTQEEAKMLFGMYQTAKLICQIMPFVPFVVALNRLEPIHQELEKVANGTADEEDYEELMWQNTFATKSEGLRKIHAQHKNQLVNAVTKISEDAFAELWDNEEDSFWDKYAKA